MNGQSTTSIIVRTNDRPRLLRRALASIKAQSYRAWHVLIIDDSVDREQTQIVAKDCLREGSYTIHPIPDSAGADTMLNFGVSKATTPLVTFHDDDDTWHRDFLKNTIAWLNTNPSALGVATRVEMIFERDTGEEFTELRREPLWANVNEFSATHLVSINRYIPSSMVIRRHVFDELDGFRDDLPVVGDWEFNLRLALHGEVGFLPETPLAYWHHRPDSTGHESNTMYREHHLHTRYDHAIRDEHLRKHAQEHGLGLLLAIAGPTQRHAMHTDHQLREVLALTHQQENLLAEQRDRLEQQRNQIAGLENQLTALNDQLGHLLEHVEDLKHNARDSALPVRAAKKVARRAGIYRLLGRP